jgi:N-acetylglutamate synthase-like GNAT family acetyltransferase
VQFNETNKHNILYDFYFGNGLEVSKNIESDDGAFYSVVALNNGVIAAAATLSFRKNIFILDYIAVDSNYRKAGLGKQAIDMIVKKAKELSAQAIFITAKEPAFFKKIGFIQGSPEGVDMNEDCLGCEKYGKECVSVPMKLILM